MPRVIGVDIPNNKRLEIALDRTRRPPPATVADIRAGTPLRELARDGLLDGFALGQVHTAPRAAAYEVGLVQREALRERRTLDQTGDAVGGRG